MVHQELTKSIEFSNHIKMIAEIMDDARKSNLYLKESGDITSARARRCLNIVENVTWLLTNEIDTVQDVLLLQSIRCINDIEVEI